VDELRLAEKTLVELSIQLHWLASTVRDETLAHRLRVVADGLSDEALELRGLWSSGFAPFDN